MKRLYPEVLPSYNAYMHEENPYKGNPPDFAALSQTYPEIQPFVGKNTDGTVYYKWSEPNATKTLTTVLLRKDFGIEWFLPDGHLAPGLPGRINYLNWLHEVLEIVPSETSEVTGIDVGTGASCIYPLLGHALYKWHFIATEIDPESVRCAEENVERNGLEKWITVCQRTSEQSLLEGVSSDPVAFSMCNPPFFSTVDEKESNPQTDCRATDSELATEGGEVTFVQRMIAESLRLQTKVRIYSSLLGRKRSLRVVLRSLREASVPSVGSTVLFQGKTCRWCVCWSFDARLQEYFDTHPERYKVFGRKKIAAQRHEVEWRAQLDEEEVWRRVEMFCDCCEGISTEWKGEQLECDVRGFVYHFPGAVGEKRGERGEECVRFSVTVEEEETNESLVSCHILNGDRKLFFKVAEQLRADVERVNRRWRRFADKRKR